MTDTKNSNIVNFRASGKNANRVLMAKTLGINMSEVMNELLEKYGDAELKKRRATLEKELERAKGFEPSTFTLARCLSLKVSVRKIGGNHVAAMREGGDVLDPSSRVITEPVAADTAAAAKVPAKPWGDRRHRPLH